MKFINLKTCQGLESHVWIEGALVPLRDLPAVLRGLSTVELIKMLDLPVCRETETVLMAS